MLQVAAEECRAPTIRRRCRRSHYCGRTGRRTPRRVLPLPRPTSRGPSTGAAGTGPLRPTWSLVAPVDDVDPPSLKNGALLGSTRDRVESSKSRDGDVRTSCSLVKIRSYDCRPNCIAFIYLASKPKEAHVALIVKAEAVSRSRARIARSFVC